MATYAQMVSWRYDTGEDFFRLVTAATADVAKTILLDNLESVERKAWAKGALSGDTYAKALQLLWGVLYNTGIQSALVAGNMPSDATLKTAVDTAVTFLV